MQHNQFNGHSLFKCLYIFCLVIVLIIGTVSCGNNATEQTKSKKKKKVHKDNTSQQQDVSDDNLNNSLDDGFVDDDYVSSLLDSDNDKSDNSDKEYRVARKYSSSEIPTSYDPVNHIIYVKDYGAKGDGVTDDGEAIYNAIRDLQNIGKNAKLVFEKNKTYLYSYESMRKYYRYIFKIDDCVNCHIEGDNTTIISGSESPREFITLTNTSGCSVSGFNFDYAIRPYFMAKSATQIDSENLSCVMEIGDNVAETYLHLNNPGETTTVFNNGSSDPGFGIIEQLDSGRKHMFISRYELVDKNKIKIYFAKGASPYTSTWINELKNSRLVCPTPGVGHAIEYATYFKGNVNFSIKNVNIYNSCKFACIVTCSEGICKFENMNFIPNPNLKGTFEETDFTSWRDGWHLKENHAKFIWDRCTATGLQDDVFNISSSIMYVSEVQSPNRINMYWPETGGAFSNLSSGDRITIIDVDKGIILAQTEISRVVSQSGANNVVTLKDSFANMPKGENIIVLFEDLVANNSEINNCNFSGTFRMRGKITISNTVFKNKMFWIDPYTWIEGPIPKDMYFKNCKFVEENDDAQNIIISAYNDNLSKSSYHVKNIVFDNCEIKRKNCTIGNGDDVKFINCR